MYIPKIPSVLHDPLTTHLLLENSDTLWGTPAPPMSDNGRHAGDRRSDTGEVVPIDPVVLEDDPLVPIPRGENMKTDMAQVELLKRMYLP